MNLKFWEKTETSKTNSSKPRSKSKIKHETPKQQRKSRVRSRASYNLKLRQKKFKARIKETTDPVMKKQLKKEYRLLFHQYYSPNRDDNIIELKKLNKFYFNGYYGFHVLKDITLTIKKGEIVLVIGDSGSGKTTLLNVMSGLISVDYGKLVVANRDLTEMPDHKKIKFRADNVSFIFQSYNLIPTLTANENIKVGYSLRDKKNKRPIEDDITIKFILKILGMEKFKNYFPYQLSGGQQQRISIGRALAKNPKILFADEPTGALDEEKGDEVLQLLIDINKKFGTTLVIVTHNLNYAKIADKIIKIRDGWVDEIKVNEKPIRKIRELRWEK